MFSIIKVTFYLGKFFSFAAHHKDSDSDSDAQNGNVFYFHKKVT